MGAASWAGDRNYERAHQAQREREIERETARKQGNVRHRYSASADRRDHRWPALFL